MIEKLYTVEEVAELASVTGRTIRNYLKSGRLVGRKIGGQWRFPEAEVQRLLTGAEPEDAMEYDVEEPARREPSPQSSATIDLEAYRYDAAPPDDSYEEEAPVQAPPRQPSYYNEPAPLPGAAQPPPRGAEPPPAYPQSAPAAPVQPQAPAGQPAYGQPAYSQPTQSPAAPQPAYSFGSRPFQDQPAGQASYQPPAPAQAPVPQAPVQPAPAVQAQPGSGYPASPVAPAPEVSSAAQPAQPFGQPGAATPPAYAAQPAPQPTVIYDPATGQPYVLAQPGQIPPGYIPVSAMGGFAPQQAATQPSPGAAPAQPEKAEPPQPEPAAEAVPAGALSDVGNRVVKYISEVHDYSKGPQVCSVVDLHQSLSSAKITSERLAEIADEESESGQLCQSYVEFDERYYVARYTLFGTTSFMMRCLKLIG